ncbi:diphthine--ammonia ligase-like isoform X2 [Ornithodoros turicata]
MYQSVGHEAIPLYAEAMEVPLFQGEITGKPCNQSGDYSATDGDEVEDLYELMRNVREKIPYDAVSVGAIFSDYQRARVQNICNRLNIEMLAYLWHRDQAKLLKEMVDSGIHAIIIKVAAMGLDPGKHLGMTIQEILPHMLKMEAKYGLNVCGEGGEYETLTLDCPLFKKRLVVDEQETVVHSDDAFAPVAYLKLRKMHLANKCPKG